MGVCLFQGIMYRQIGNVNNFIEHVTVCHNMILQKTNRRKYPIWYNILNWLFMFPYSSLPDSEIPKLQLGISSPNGDLIYTIGNIISHWDIFCQFSNKMVHPILVFGTTLTDDFKSCSGTYTSFQEILTVLRLFGVFQIHACNSYIQ